MKGISFWLVLLIGGFLMGACDDGCIPEVDVIPQTGGYVAKLTGNLTGIKRWSNPYTVVLAGFSDDSDYATVLKNLPTNDGNISVTLANIPTDTQRVELCVTNALRKHIITLASITIGEASGDTIRLDVGQLDASQFATIQQHVFSTTCANCHGSSTFAAAGLHLTEGKSYNNLINSKSSKETGLMRIKPGDAENSVLFRALTTDISSDGKWRYDHTSEVVNENILTLIANWINAGASE